MGNPSDQKEASAGKEEEPTEAYQQGRKVVATKSNDHTIKTCKTWAKGKPDSGANLAANLTYPRTLVWSLHFRPAFLQATLVSGFYTPSGP